MSNIPQSKEALHNHLNEQIGFLLRSAESYDKGFTNEAKRLAVTIRILVHDTGKSTSLLKQLDLKSQLFYDTAVEDESDNKLPYSALIQMVMGPSSATYIPFLDDRVPIGVPRFVPFDEWWNRVIFRSKEVHPFSRRDLILSVADQDGGAHIDPNLNEAYSKLSRDSGMGWTYNSPQKSYTIRPPELAAVRQIAHEILKTFKPNYEAHPNIPVGSVAIGGISIKEVKDNEHIVSVHKKTTKVGRNDPCPCGSGKKYKKCHGAA